MGRVRIRGVTTKSSSTVWTHRKSCVRVSWQCHQSAVLFLAQKVETTCRLTRPVSEPICLFGRSGWRTVGLDARHLVRRGLCFIRAEFGVSFSLLEALLSRIWDNELGFVLPRKIVVRIEAHSPIKWRHWTSQMSKGFFSEFQLWLVTGSMDGPCWQRCWDWLVMSATGKAVWWWSSSHMLLLDWMASWAPLSPWLGGSKGCKRLRNWPSSTATKRWVDLSSYFLNAYIKIS